jgi:hypothetical protein
MKYLCFATPLDNILLKMLEEENVNAVLASYYYLHDNNRAINKVLEFVDKTKAKVYIDSGIYSLKGKLGITVSKPIWQFTEQDRADMLKKSREKGKDYDTFFEAYMKFMQKYYDNFDHFFNFDVEEFLGFDYVDKYTDIQLEAFPEKAIVVWHQVRGWQAWKDMCQKYDYLSVCGGYELRYNVPFYRALLKEVQGKCHALALSSPYYVTRIDCDSCDSTSWLMGGKYADVYTPLGMKKVNFGKKQMPDSFNCQSELVKKELAEYFKSIGFTIDDLYEGYKSRIRANIIFFKDLEKRWNEQEAHSYHQQSMEDLWI